MERSLSRPSEWKEPIASLKISLSLNISLTNSSNVTLADPDLSTRELQSPRRDWNIFSTCHDDIYETQNGTFLLESETKYGRCFRIRFLQYRVSVHFDQPIVQQETTILKIFDFNEKFIEEFTMKNEAEI